MMGVARTIRSGKVIQHEFLLIDTDSEGGYLPRISSGSEPVKFRLTTQRASEAIFENPAHDFPQTHSLPQDRGRLICADRGETEWR
jgi:hypothetical protein